MVYYNPNPLREVHFNEVEVDCLPIDDGLTVYHLTDIKEGLTDEDREGALIKIIHVSGTLSVYARYAYTQLIRVIICIDLQNNSTPPTFDEVMANVNALALYNAAGKNASRFQVIYDGHATPKYYPGTYFLERRHTLDFSIPVDSIVRYDGALGSDACQGKMYMFIISNRPDWQPSVYGSTRVSFVNF